MIPVFLGKIGRLIPSHKTIKYLLPYSTAIVSEHQWYDDQRWYVKAYNVIKRLYIFVDKHIFDIEISVNVNQCTTRTFLRYLIYLTTGLYLGDLLYSSRWKKNVVLRIFILLRQNKKGWSTVKVSSLNLTFVANIKLLRTFVNFC